MKSEKTAPPNPRIGVLTALFNGNHHSELLTGIEAAARNRNAQIIYFPGASLRSPCPFETQRNIIYDIALNASLDGLIILSAVTNYCREKEIIDFISPYSHIPLQTINFRAPFGGAILTDYKSGFTTLMNHLINTHGYRKLAFLRGPEFNSEAEGLFNIYKTEIARAGIPFQQELVVDGNYSYFSGLAAVKIYEERGLKAGRDIEVIVCANDSMAAGVTDALNDSGLAVPGDIAVTGFDNLNEAVFPKRPLTTVKPHLYEIGNNAVNALLDNKTGQQPQYFRSELVLNYTCGCSQPETHTDPFPMPQEVNGAESYKKDLNFVFYQYIFIINNLIQLKKKSELTTWMQNHFPSLGIKSAWIFIDSQQAASRRTYSLLTGYDGNNQKNTIIPPARDIDEDFIFNDFLQKKDNRSYSVFPLLFKDERYGLLVIEVNRLAFINYDTLCNLIGSSIKNILLGEELELKNSQLLRSNSLLKEANEQKTRFFINIAHETKTPLTLIRNYLSRYMKKHTHDDDLLIIKQNIDQLLDNMLNFLDAEKLQKGNTLYQHEDLVDLAESAHKKYRLFQVAAETRNIKLSLQTEATPLIRIDPWAMDRIFNNLLDNAVKYTQEGGLVKISVESGDGKAILRVYDNGPGIPPDIREHLFDPYYLLSKSRTGRQGIGVGLSIVKKIVDGLGACLEVENRKGRGTCFSVIFTDSSNEAPQREIREIPHSSPSPVMRGIIKEKNLSPEKENLLIVDDNIQLLSFLQTTFEESYNVFLARDTEEAILKLKTIPHPDLIISDIMMDGPDGFQLLDRLSSMEGYNDIPFIFLTALGDETARITGLNLGAVDYIEKPFSVSTLQAKIESLIALRRHQIKNQIKHIRSSIETLFSESQSSEKEQMGGKWQQINSLCKEYSLNSREEEIVRLLLAGLVHKEIAAHLNLSLRTVEYDITKIYKKCGVNGKFDFLEKFRI